MNAIADESVDGPIVKRLREDGHKIAYVAELDPGISDDVVLSRARNEGLLLITADKDFGELVFRQGQVSAGVLLLRLSGLSPDRKARLVAQVVAEREAELNGSFAVLTEQSIRIRKRS